MSTARRFWLAGLAAAGILVSGCQTIRDVADEYRDWRDEQEQAEQEQPSKPPQPWPKACSRIEAAMVTPLFVYADAAQVSSQAAALAGGGYNAVVSLVDLQSGRSYIFPGRGATALDARCLANIRRVLDAGITPILIVRNDWAVRTRTGAVPSIGGQPATAAGFYSATMLDREKAFLDSLAELYPFIHIQLSIEPEVPESAGFALALAQHLRAAGFAGRILLNPTGAALTAHQGMQAALTAAKCELARSWHAEGKSPDEVWNTDGRTAINAGNAQAVLKTIRASGKEFILWSQELANSPNGIPAGYLAASAPVTPPATPSEPVQAGDNTFLWKPVSESRQGRCAVITPANLNVSKVHVNGSNQTAEYAGRANGDRQHWFLNKTGAAFGANVKVEAFDKASGKIIRTWTVPNGAARWGSN